MNSYHPAPKKISPDLKIHADQPAEFRTSGGFRASEAQPLGNTTKFTDELGTKDLHLIKENQKVREVFDAEKGEIFSYERTKSGDLRKKYSRDGALLERWMLQRNAQKILSRPEFWEEREKQVLVPYSDLDHRVEVCLLSENAEKKGKVSRVKPRSLGALPIVRSKKYFIKGSLNKSPTHRVVMCHRNVVPGKSPELWQSQKEDRSCSYHSIAVCGSVWTCPICSLKINLKRREQIRESYKAIRNIEGAAYMLTFTVKHGIGDNIDDLLSRFKNAMQIFQKTHEYKEVTRPQPLKKPRANSLNFLSYLGRIAALEVTHSRRNGWHPHEHHLWFFERELTKKEISDVRDRLFRAWKKACLDAGLPAPRKTVKVDGKIKHLGLDMRRALSAEEYLTKYGQFDAEGNVRERRWGPENEMAGSHVKKANLKGSTPFQLLADATAGDDYARERFVEFAEAFKGRHQLHFSKKLNDFLKQQKVDVSGTDDEIAHAKDSNFEFLYEFQDLEFEKIVHHKVHDHVLVMTRTHGIEVMRNYLKSLPEP